MLCYVPPPATTTNSGDGCHQRLKLLLRQRRLLQIGVAMLQEGPMMLCYVWPSVMLRARDGSATYECPWSC
jgi:hypothetical protein